MCLDWLKRTVSLIGEDKIKLLNDKTVTVLGVGGVGCACIEALCRAGIGKLIIVDKDEFDITNLNRQNFATTGNIGQSKVIAAYEKIKSINPSCEVITHKMFYLPETANALFEEKTDFVVDAIDTVTAKLDLAQRCYKNDIPLISCMGTGNRLDPTKFVIGDISDTVGSGCNLSKVMRRELKKREVPMQTVLYSTELPQVPLDVFTENGRHAPASISFVPPVAGYILASYVIIKLIQNI